jgi:geranylgeranyl diphosphate synthase type II
MPLRRYMREQARRVEAALDQVLPAATEPPTTLHEAMRYAVFGPGTRLRPILCLAAADLFGPASEQALLPAAALELVHTYSLVHDDLPCMDDDDLRRGRPTCHRVYGEAMAVLAGDALLTEAFTVLAEWGRGEDPALALRITGELAAAAGSSGMVGGQVLDLAGSGQHPTASDLEQVHLLKTGRLFRAALRIGALVGGASTADLAALDEFAHYFGLAFQIHDDVLDVTGSEEETGKRRGSDERQERATYVAVYGLEAARMAAKSAASAAVASLGRFGENAAMLESLAELAATRGG